MKDVQNIVVKGHLTTVRENLPGTGNASWLPIATRKETR